MLRSRPMVSFKRVFENVVASHADGETQRQTRLREDALPPSGTRIGEGYPIRWITHAAALERYISNTNLERAGPADKLPATGQVPTVEEVLSLNEARNPNDCKLDDLKKLRRDVARECHPVRNREVDPRVMMLANSRIDALVAEAIRRGRRNTARAL